MAALRRRGTRLAQALLARLDAPDPLEPRTGIDQDSHDLGLDGHITQIFNSAQSGYEKPHPRAFDGVLEAVTGADAAWMVGDNPKADVRGAEAVGLPAILVRGPKRGARHHCEDLSGIVDIV